jgi:integrase
MLTDKAVRAAIPEGVLHAKLKLPGKAHKLYDEKGLFLLVQPNGSRLWRFKYRFAGKEKLLALGSYPEISLKEARKRRDEARRALDDGKDPSAERRAGKLRAKAAAANSFEAIALEWYQKQLPVRTQRHAADMKRRLESNLFPFLGRRPIAEIEAPELLEVVRRIEKRGATDLSHRIVQLAGQIFRYAIATGRCKRDIAHDLRGALAPHEKRHLAAVSQHELPDLLKAIAGYDDKGNKQTRLGLQLLALTFVRTRELIEAEWSEFNMDEAMWVVPANRMKKRREHTVPLSRQVLKGLVELRKLSRGSRFIFPGRNYNRPISNNTLLFALHRLGYKGRMTGHGFRAVASTILNEAGFRSDVIEAQLAHVEPSAARAAYNRAQYLPERRKMMQWWADYLGALKVGGKVIAIRKLAIQ